MHVLCSVVTCCLLLRATEKVNGMSEEKKTSSSFETDRKTCGENYFIPSVALVHRTLYVEGLSDEDERSLHL